MPDFTGYRKWSLAALAIVSATLSVAMGWIAGTEYVTTVVGTITTFCAANALGKRVASP